MDKCPECNNSINIEREENPDGSYRGVAVCCNYKKCGWSQ